MKHLTFEIHELITDFLVGSHEYWKFCFKEVILEINDYQPKNIMKNFFDYRYNRLIDVCCDVNDMMECLFLSNIKHVIWRTYFLYLKTYLFKHKTYLNYTILRLINNILRNNYDF